MIHEYNTTLRWTGANEKGTKEYRSYQRSYDIEIHGKPVIKGSSDPLFRGEKEKHNPEDLFVASVSTCHMLTYLHLCSVNKIVVFAYEDKALGEMHTVENKSGHFSKIVLHPKVTISKESNKVLAEDLHRDANVNCFIAQSCNFPIEHIAEIRIHESD